MARLLIDGETPEIMDVIEEPFSSDGKVDLPELEVHFEELRGQLFISGMVNYTNHNDAAYGQSIQRQCSCCFYRGGPSNHNRDCQIIPHLGDKHPKELFGIDKEEYLPEQLEGKEVGNYCPHFTDWRVE